MATNPESEEFDFAEFVREFGHGTTNQAATESLRNVVRACSETGRKGNITIKFDVAVHGGLAELRASISTKTPESPLPGSTYYTDDAGSLLDEDPRQMSLPTKILDARTDTLRTIPFTAPTPTKDS